MFGQPHAQVARFLGATAIATILCASTAQAQPAREADYALPAQSLSRSLRDVSVRSGTSVIAPSELVAGRRAPPLRGRYGPRQALELLLQGSGLRVSLVGQALVVSRADSSAEGPSVSATEPPQSEPIVVTGTNIWGGQSTSPVIVLGRQDIDESGASSVEQLMAKLPQNAQGGVNRENFQVPGAGADPTEHGSGLNLRGLGQRATLVLINGRRVAPSNTGAFVDVSLIPLSAVERVEILTDGASAIYGSDAVGGVVNFILRDNFEGVETLAQIGSATNGDGDLLQLGATAGASWRGGRALLSYEFRLEDEILVADRPFAINLAPSTFLFPRDRRHSLFGNLVQDITSSLGLEATGYYAQRDTERSFFLSGNPVPVGLIAEAESYGFSGGLRYQPGASWSIQLTGGHSFTRTDERQARPTTTPLVNERFIRNSVSDLGLKLDGTLFELPGGSVRVALGGELRWERYDESFRTNTINVTFDPTRNVAAAFVELQVPLFSSLNRRPGLERLIVTAAGRYEHYDRFGSTLDPKLGILWSPIPGLAFRSTYDTSFRAPLLSETAGVYSAIYVPAIFVYRNAADATGVGLALGGSNPGVQPERSRSWTLGADIAPRAVPGLTLRMNYYSIRFSDRIALPAPSITVVGDPAFDSIVTRDPDDDLVRELIAGAQVATDVTGPGFSNGGATPADVSAIVDGRFNNTAVTKTRGLDFNLAYRFAAGASRFLVAANVNYILSFTDRLRPTSATIDTLDTPFGPLDFRARAQAGWSRDGWSANLFVNHADDYRDRRGTRDLRVDSFTTFDLGLAYDAPGAAPAWLRGTRIALNVENLFDRDPPFLLPDTGSTSGTGYDPVNASGRGRFVSLQLRRRW
ncbi:MAG: TonB-dependent receptor domain-containing protein [Sphingosinicella sp.]|uniref:TonB-dependent receptor domain-containing protein n=1 Tax=Sphingosinicella sp. TaxID=1917971 RepID=UPI00403828E7